ncbi:MAG: hypothetical protein WCV62_00270 [Candidatus Peribacteraceae bacterium]|jgi:hypothetical protein
MGEFPASPPNGTSPEKATWTDVIEGKGTVKTVVDAERVTVEILQGSFPYIFHLTKGRWVDATAHIAITEEIHRLAVELLQNGRHYHDYETTLNSTYFNRMWAQKFECPNHCPLCRHGRERGRGDELASCKSTREKNPER